nr:monovalent cation/H(+) antiporter subunit G [Roseomonas acroporae]
MEQLPAWAAVPAALLLLAGAAMTLLGSIGLLRLGGFYERVHAPTLGTSAGIACVLLASMLVFSVLQSRPVLHELLVGLAVIVTTPVTLMLLARAALYRDRQEADATVPARQPDAPAAGPPAAPLAAPLAAPSAGPGKEPPAGDAASAAP